MPSRRAASEMLPPASDSTRLMCSHSARASDGALYSSESGAGGSSGGASARANAPRMSSASAGFGREKGAPRPPGADPGAVVPAPGHTTGFGAGTVSPHGLTNSEPPLPGLLQAA